MKLEQAIKIVCKALREYPDYRLSWRANIEMAFQDEWARQREFGEPDVSSCAYNAANNFLDLLTKEEM